MKKILIIAAHPDDEILGVGGTLLKHKKNGDILAWLIITVVSEDQGYSSEKVHSRKMEILKVAELFAIDEVFELGYLTMKLSSSSLIKMVPEISRIFNKVQPEVIYTMNRSDAHSDHRVIFDAVSACTKAFRYPYIKKVLMYECISETEFAPAIPERVFQPNYFVDISNYLDKKNEIMQVYQSELGEHPFPRSNKNIEALATFRGATVGVKFAEAFQLLKFIDK